MCWHPCVACRCMCTQPAEDSVVAAIGAGGGPRSLTPSSTRVRPTKTSSSTPRNTMAVPPVPAEVIFPCMSHSLGIKKCELNVSLREDVPEQLLAYMSACRVARAHFPAILLLAHALFLLRFLAGGLSLLVPCGLASSLLVRLPRRGFDATRDALSPAARCRHPARWVSCTRNTDWR